MPCMGCSTEKHAARNQEVTVWRFGHENGQPKTEAPRLSQAAAQLKDQAPEMKVRTCRVKWKELILSERFPGVGTSRKSQNC